MKNYHSLLKSFLFTVFMATHLLCLSMNDNKDITLRGFINLATKPIKLVVGSIEYPYLSVEVQPQSGKLVNYPIPRGSNGSYYNINLIKIEEDTFVKFSPSGKYKNFVLIQLSDKPADYLELPLDSTEASDEIGNNFKLPFSKY